MKQPIASLTNLAYGIAAIFVWSISIPVAIAFVVLMLGSGWYHATLTPQSQAGDHIGMYAVFTMLLALGLGANPLSYLVNGFIFLIFVIPYFISKSWDRFDLRIGTGILVTANMIAVGIKAGWEMTIMLIIMFTVILLIRDAADKHYGARSVYRSHEIMHGTWHLWTAYGIYLIALFLA